MLEFALEPMPHDEAAKLIADKPAVTKDVFNALPDELKARAFTITGIEDFDVLAAVRDRIAELPAGADWNKVKKDVISEISPWFNSVAAEKRAELLMRHHAFTAYAAAQAREMDELIDVFPYRQYISTEDSRVRPSHAALHGIILPATHKFWATHTPPWEWNCRCDVVELTGEDVEEERQRDGKRAADAQRVLTGPALKMLENDHRLVRGLGINVDLRTPKQKGGNFEINVRDLNMNYEEIQKRWDDKTKEDFETWAENIELDTSNNLLGWLKGVRKTPAKVTSKVLGLIGVRGKRQKGAQAITLLEDLKLADKAVFSIKDTARIRAAIKMPKANKFKTKVQSVTGDWDENLSEKEVAKTVQGFFNYLDPEVIKTLPEFKIKVIKTLPDTTNGQWKQATKILELNANNYRRNKEKMTKTVYHELTHWVHENSSPEKRAAVKAYFSKRVKGEKLKHLPGYKENVKGYEDDFGILDEVYAGRVYPWELSDPQGTELATRHLEKLALSNAKLRDHLNRTGKTGEKMFREGFINMLPLLYEDNRKNR